MNKNFYKQFILVILIMTGIHSSLFAKEIYLTTDGTDLNDGLTNLTAVATFGKAYSLASENDIINVSGIIDISTDPLNTLSPKAGLLINKSITIIGTNKTSDGFNGSNLTRIFQVSGVTTTLTLQNLTFKNGKYLKNGTNGGALILNSNAKVTGENIIFDKNTGNDVTSTGGAIYVTSTSGLTLKKCLFSNNEGRGAAIYIYEGAGAISRFENCAFIGNSYNATSNGGSAVYIRSNGNGCVIDFVNSTFKGNSVGQLGALYIYGGLTDTKISMYNCTMMDNISQSVSNPTINNAAGIHVLSGFLGTLGIYNSIIEGNRTSAPSANNLNDIYFVTSPVNETKLIVYNSVIGRCVNFNTITLLPDACYPQLTNKANYFNYNYSSNNNTNYDLKAGLGDYNSTYYCYPLVAGATAIGFGDSQWLGASYGNSITDQLGRIRNLGCSAGSVEGKLSVVSNSNLSALLGVTDVQVAGSVELTVDQSSSMQNIVVAPDGKLTLNSGSTLAINSSLTLQSDASGTGTFVDHNITGGLTVTGTNNVEQFLSVARQWWYVSSPLSAAKTTIFTDITHTNKIGYYDEVNTSYSSPLLTDVPLTVGKGYVVKLTDPSDRIYNFIGGNLNTGSIPLDPAPTRTGNTAGKRGFNLVGNPYPSYVDWDLLHADAATTNIQDAIWYRTYSSGMTFHTYSNGEVVPRTASGIIPPMQGFWIKVDADESVGTLSFKNTHRKHHEGETANPLKVKANTNTQRLRLVVANSISSDETLIVVKSNGLDGYDKLDIEKMYSESDINPEIYSIVNNQPIVINTINQMKSGQSISLGFRNTGIEPFTITASQMENIPTDISVYLVNNSNPSTAIEISEGVSYTFDPTATNLSVQFRSKSVVSNLSENKQQNIFAYQTNNNQLIVVCNEHFDASSKISVFNSLGQKLIEQRISNSSTTISREFKSGVYLVKVNNELLKVTIR